MRSSKRILWFLELRSTHPWQAHPSAAEHSKKINIIACYLSTEEQTWTFNGFLSQRLYVDCGSKDHLHAHTTRHVSFLHSYFVMRKKSPSHRPRPLPEILLFPYKTHTDTYTHSQFENLIHPWPLEEKQASLPYYFYTQKDTSLLLHFVHKTDNYKQ